MTMFLKNVKYIVSAPSKKFWIASDKKEICIVGRSNVGKSTFINKICNHNALARVSNTPGYTKYINFFDVNNSFYLADTPGYGYAKASWSRDESFANMMQEYIYERENLICVIMIVDGKVGFTSDDVLLLDMLRDANRQVLVVASKIDKTNQSLRSAFMKKAKEVLDESEYNNMLLYSALKPETVTKVVEKIISIYNN